jgi:hypothetical protein
MTTPKKGKAIVKPAKKNDMVSLKKMLKKSKNK